MNGQKFFACLVVLAAFASASYAQTDSGSCPNQVTFGVHPTGPIDRASEARVDVTYFTTADPHD